MQEELTTYLLYMTVFKIFKNIFALLLLKIIRLSAFDVFTELFVYLTTVT